MEFFKRLKSLYRIDSVPWIIRPFYYLYGFVFGGFLYAYFRFVNLTSRIEISGDPPNDRNYIFCIWHCSWPGYFSLWRDHSHHAWINHPLWYMVHIWRLADFLGVGTQIPGSAGHDGRAAAERLVDRLKDGFSTIISPDGPAGPPKHLKRGVFHIAEQSGVPIVGISIELTSKVVLRSWDRKEIPLPWGIIKVHFSKPLNVDATIARHEREKLGAIVSQYLN